MILQGSKTLQFVTVFKPTAIIACKLHSIYNEFMGVQSLCRSLTLCPRNSHSFYGRWPFLSAVNTQKPQKRRHWSWNIQRTSTSPFISLVTSLISGWNFFGAGEGGTSLRIFLSPCKDLYHFIEKYQSFCVAVAKVCLICAEENLTDCKWAREKIRFNAIMP